MLFSCRTFKIFRKVTSAAQVSILTGSWLSSNLANSNGYMSE